MTDNSLVPQSFNWNSSKKFVSYDPEIEELFSNKWDFNHMHSNIRPIAVKAAVLIFFIMGFVGTYKGYRPDVCCSRAFAGAFVTFAIVTVVGKIVVGILEKRLKEAKREKIAHIQQKMRQKMQEAESENI